ncbi:MAG: hypothetical protein HYY13_02135 [Nitrospirae bacterium]|nr:hypothetical protein [Nitrospirota bacterium]
MSAQLLYPGGVALLPNPGDFVVGDTTNHRVRRVVGGVIETIAGNGTPAFTGDGGLAAAASLNAPIRVEATSNAEVYISDLYNGRVRKLAPPNVPAPLAPGTTIYPIRGVTLTFNDGTTTSGNVGVRASNEFPPDIVENFDLGPSANAPQRLLYDIDLNGVTLPPGGTVTICINYGNQFTGGQENAIKLFHANPNPPPDFENITCPKDGSDPECPPQDEANNVICGKTTSFSEFFPGIDKSVSGTADLDPDVLNTKSQGNPVTAYIELCGGESPSLIVPATVALTAASGQAIGPLPAFDQPVAVGDGNNNGITDLKVQFNRQALIAALQALGLTGDVTLDVQGSLTDGRSFKAPGTIEVK